MAFTFTRRSLLGATFLALSAASLTFSNTSFAEENNTLIVAFGAQPPSLDPHVTTTSTTNVLARNIFETLVTLDANMKVQPGLAQSWRVSEDGRTYRFTLRPGIRFHDGEPLTSKDVVASLKRWQAYSLTGKSVFEGANWTAEGADTIVLNLPVPRFNALEALAPAYTQDPVIMPSVIAEAATDKPVSQLIGTGPFRLISWEPDRALELERYADYTPFNGTQSGTAGDRTPAFAKLRIEFVPDESTRTFGLSSGEYDIATPLAYDSISELRSNGELNLGSASSAMLNLGFNYGKPSIFQDKRAREAINLGLERKSILTAAAVDPQFFRLNNHLMLLAQKQWATDAGDTDFNPADVKKAKNLLLEAGYEGKELVLITSRDFAEMYNAAIVVQQQLQTLGLKVKLESYDWSTYVKVRADKQAWDMVILGASPKPAPTQLIFLNKDFPGGPQDGKLEEILADFRKAGTIEQAKELYRKLEEWNQTFIPSVRIGEVDYPFATSKRVQAIQVQYDLIFWTARLSD
ncbi:ABC transporter substrate-binding protein [Ensifer sp. BR816]|uniref:ABC transporter substrate-binding protein n=1 Tax=Rhizobium sp. (strain BR816) TaxID=1057002 RepID=UPI0003628360|nr:ABC transporter substrate-binding protein [Ensifer sp. BR816]